MNIFHKLLIAMVLMIGLIVGVITYWNLEGVLFHKILNTNELVFQTTQQVYHQGDMVQGKFSACKSREVDPIITWSLIDTYLRPYLSKMRSDGIHGCVADQITNIELLSDTLPADNYYFSGSLVYQLNPIKQIIIPMRTNRFKVIEGVVAGGAN